MPVPELTLLPARLVRTMDPSRPTAQAVLVRGDRVRAVGSLDELAAYGPATVDERFADAVLFPGFVEAHSHVFSGGVWRELYVGFHERTSPDGRRWPGCTTPAAVLDRLREAAAALPDPDAPVVAWGLDPIYFPDERLVARHLDTVSATRPIAVKHQSGHLATVNSALLRAEGITRDTAVVGVEKDDRGEPSGELREFAAMGLVRRRVQLLGFTGFDPQVLRNFAADACNHGTTTLTDLGTRALTDLSTVQGIRSVVDDDGYPARLSLFHLAVGSLDDALHAVEQILDLRPTSTDKLRFGHVKFILDGSNQGFTGRLLAPGYLPDDRKGIWVTAPEAFQQQFAAFHAAGLTVHVHCNGDEATELFLDTVEEALARHPRWDHRHTVTHSQLSTAAQYRRMRALGLCANIFANHTFYWGDQHRDSILGPDRASRMNAAATALREGVPISLHCDTPVTPLDPLATASIAATRRTASGQVLGEHERITVAQALQAMTLGAAYMLKMDHEVGSVEAGKYADLAVLGADPFTAGAEEVRDIEVRGTVVGGRFFPAGRAG